MTKPPLHPPEYLFITSTICAILLAISAVCVVREIPLIQEGPAQQQLRVMQTIINSHSIQAPQFKDAHEHLLAKSSATGRAYYQDMYVLGSAGQLFPKHALLHTLIATPFFATLGELGLWLFNQLVYILLMISCYRIYRSVSGRPLRLGFVAIVAIGTQSIWQSYGFSYDLFIACLIICGLDLTQHRPFWGALVMGLSIAIRSSCVLLVVPLLFSWKSRHSAREIALAIFGTGVALLVFFAQNWWMFDTPLTHPYSHIPAYSSGEMMTLDHPVGFDIDTFLSDWSAKFFGAGEGLILWNLILLALPWALWHARRSEERWFLYTLSFAALLNALYIFSYPMWSITEYGNRYLMASIFLWAISICCAFGQHTSQR